MRRLRTADGGRNHIEKWPGFGGFACYPTVTCMRINIPHCSVRIGDSPNTILNRYALRPFVLAAENAFNSKPVHIAGCLIHCVPVAFLIGCAGGGSRVIGCAANT